jgi:hypothetical protein
LVRADGVGAWSYELQRLITGPTKGSFIRRASNCVSQLSQRVAPGTDSWQRIALDELSRAERALGLDGVDPKSKTALTSFFFRFSQLRNKSRGHGAQHVSHKGEAAAHLDRALQAIIDNFELFQSEWFRLMRKSSGALRSYPLSQNAVAAGSGAIPRMADDDQDLQEGVYFVLDGNAFPVHLIQIAEPELSASMADLELVTDPNAHLSVMDEVTLRVSELLCRGIGGLPNTTRRCWAGTRPSVRWPG